MGPSRDRAADCYNEGEGVAKDEAEAARWSLLEAEQDDTEPQFRTGLSCIEDQGILWNEGRVAR